MQSTLLSLLPALLLPASPSSAQTAPPSPDRLLNAYHSPLSALTSPGSHYFLDFPWRGNFDPSSNGGPRCADGTPYSFIFRRGSDLHADKLLVEFGGESPTSTSAPWRGAQSLQVQSTDVPPLGVCTGMSYGFVSRGAKFLGLDGTSGGDDGDGDADVPIFLRRGRRDEDDPDTTPILLRGQKAWWERLGGEHSSVHDWSYVFVPHCTPGEENDSVTESNVRAVLDWVDEQFAPAKGGKGLDALVAVAGGGRVGGGGCSPPASTTVDCGAGCEARTTSPSPSTRAARFASAAPMRPSRNALVVVDGSALRWDSRLEGAVEDALSGGRVEVAWVASGATRSPGGAATKEGALIQSSERAFGDSFRAYRPPVPPAADADAAAAEPCPLYAFSDASGDDGGFGEFIGSVARAMPWSTEEARDETADARDESERLSFLSIVLILLGAYLSSWAAYLLLGHHRRRRARRDGSEAVIPPSPHDLWFAALTGSPLAFLVVSVAVPVILSYVAYARNGYTVSVNLDFDTYLDIATKEELEGTQYRNLLQYQKDTLKLEEANCQLLYEGLDKEPTFDSRELSGAADKARHSKHRGLTAYGKSNGRPVINFFYQNRRGGTVFTTEVLESIRKFERSIMDMPDFQELCYSNVIATTEGVITKQCVPFDSIINYFYPDGVNLVDDVDSVLRSFPGSKLALAKMDKYFSMDNLGSNVTTTTVWLDYVKPYRKDKVNRFLDSLHQKLWEADLEETYPDMLFSWRNEHMQDTEATLALEHDFKWSLAALAFIGLMIFVKVLDLVTVIAGLVGLVLSFTAALYWQHHFNFNELTAMHVAGVFVMLGIGADDIFLTIDSYEHTKVDYIINADEEQADSEAITRRLEDLEDPAVIKQRLVQSYKSAGSMMLVSSTTTAICFFSNLFSTVIAVRDFGSYMGMVVVLNYIHVMTILPSALLVNELYIKPLRRKIRAAICSRGSEGSTPNSETPPNTADEEVGRVDTPAETPVALSSSMSEDATDDKHINIQSHPQSDYKFLDHTKEMSSFDRVAVLKYAPAVYRWRIIIVTISTIAAVTLAVLAWLNFSMYDGTIVVFKEQYNLGRVQRIVDQYYPEDLIKLYLDNGFDSVGDDGGDTSGASAADLSTGSGFVGSLLGGSGSGSGSGGGGGTGGGSGSGSSGSQFVIKPATPPPSTARPSYHPSGSPSLPPSISKASDASTSQPSQTVSDVAISANDTNANETPSLSLLSVCSGVFVSNEGNYYPQAPFQLNPDTYVFGGLEGGGLKMRAVDSTGQLVGMPRWTYEIASIDELTRMIWKNANVVSWDDDYFTVSDVELCDVGVVVPGTSPPTLSPTVSEGPSSSQAPSFPPTVSAQPTTSPSQRPSFAPTISAQPTKSHAPSPAPSESAMPSVTSTQSPSAQPTESQAPTGANVSNIMLGWYPNWTADSRGCLNDGKQPAFMNEFPESFLSDTLAACCGLHFAWDPNPNNCLGPLDDGDTLDLSTSSTCIDDPTWYGELNNFHTCDYVALNSGSWCSLKSADGTLASDACAETCGNCPTISAAAASSSSTSTTTDSTMNVSSLTAPPVPPPTSPPTTQMPTTSPPTQKPTQKSACPPGLSSQYCIQTSGQAQTYQKKEYYVASMVWGMSPVRFTPNVWTIRDKTSMFDMNHTLTGDIDVSDELVQKWLLDVVTIAREEKALSMHPQLVWIEALKDYALTLGLGFPLPSDMFQSVVEQLKTRSVFFRKLVEREIATKGPGIAGECLYASVSMLSEMPFIESSSEFVLESWTNFTDDINRMLPEDMPPMFVYSNAFLDSLRETAIIDSTISSYLFGNGVVLLVVLLFTQNILLTLLVMIALILILLCLAGLTFFAFQIKFGPVESLGISIFVGLSSNYLLHIAHAYHASRIKERRSKLQRSVFITGSPIVWSAISTMGGSAFLFACRTWLLTELGILICTVIGLSLIFSLGFLVALLAIMGPLPLVSDDGVPSHLHTCDFMSIITACMGKHSKKNGNVQAVVTAESSDEDGEDPEEKSVAAREAEESESSDE